MNADDSSEEGGSQCQKQRQCDHGLGWSILDTTSPPEDPHQGRSDGVDEEQNVGDAREQDPEGCDAGASVYERNAEGEQDPSHYVVANTSGQYYDPNVILKKLKLSQDST